MDNDLPPSTLEVGVTPTAETPSEPAPEPQPIVPESSNQQPAAPVTTPEKKPGKLLKILIPVIAILVIGGVVLLAITANPKPAPVEDQGSSAGAPTPPDDPDTIDDVGDEEVSATWTNDGELAATYLIKFHPKTGDFYLKETPACTGEDCETEEEETNDIIYKGTFPAVPFAKILLIYDAINFDNKNADLEIKQEFFYALAMFAGSEYETFTCTDAVGSEDQAACAAVDTDGDGTVSRDELATKALNEVVEKLTK